MKQYKEIETNKILSRDEILNSFMDHLKITDSIYDNMSLNEYIEMIINFEIIEEV